jgi:hypothetical protein
MTSDPVSPPRRSLHRLRTRDRDDLPADAADERERALLHHLDVVEGDQRVAFVGTQHEGVRILTLI